MLFRNSDYFDSVTPTVHNIYSLFGRQFLSIKQYFFFINPLIYEEQNVLRYVSFI